MIEQFRLFARRYLSRETRRRLARLAIWPPVEWARFDHLRRLKRVSLDYGNSCGQVIYDIRKVIATLHRILKPGGVLLATASGMAQLSLEDFDKWGEDWRFTSLSARFLFEEVFSAGIVTVRSYGNVLATISFLEGLAVEDLKKKELNAVDRSYEVLIAVRAVKTENIK